MQKTPTNEWKYPLLGLHSCPAGHSTQSMHSACKDTLHVSSPEPTARGSAIAVYVCCINKGRTLYTTICAYHNKCDRQVIIECQLCRQLQLNILVDLTRNTVPTRRIQHHPMHTLTYHSLQTLLLYTISRLYCYEKQQHITQVPRELGFKRTNVFVMSGLLHDVYSSSV